jgi:hypothetical protein
MKNKEIQYSHTLWKFAVFIQSIILSIQNQLFNNFNNRNKILQKELQLLTNNFINFEEEIPNSASINKEYENVKWLINWLKDINSKINNIIPEKQHFLYATWFHNISNIVMRYAQTLNKNKQCEINHTLKIDIITKQKKIINSLSILDKYMIRNFTKKNSISQVIATVEQLIPQYDWIIFIKNSIKENQIIQCDLNVIYIIICELFENYEKYWINWKLTIQECKSENNNIQICELKLSNEIKPEINPNTYSTQQWVFIIKEICEKIWASYIINKENNMYNSSVKIPIV